VRERLRRFILGLDPDASFEELALSLFAWQIERNPDYAAFAGALRPTSVEAIPAVPVELFRDLDLTCFPALPPHRVFLTSGTTSGRRGAHRLQDTELYDLGAERWFRACVPQVPASCVALLPSPREVPESSLAHMVGSFFPDADHFVDARGRLDRAAAWTRLQEAKAPVFLASTGFALAELFDGRELARLPEGSLIMVTGGFKGRHTRLEEGPLLREALDRLGEGARVVGEYGMTELSSQLWTRPFRPSSEAPPPYLPPPWMRVLAVDPGTGELLPSGVEGQLRFVDLANDQTVLAIETMDRGIVEADGVVRLLGRLPSAPLRGCSLAVEEARALRSRAP
jgi:hypothetical protein